MYNTIILLKGEERYLKKHYKNFEKGDTIFGIDSQPQELKRWKIEKKKEAKEELAKYRCSYRPNFDYVDIEEYALQYCDCDEEGEFIEGADYDLAEEAKNVD